MVLTDPAPPKTYGAALPPLLSTLNIFFFFTRLARLDSSAPATLHHGIETQIAKQL